MAEDLFDAFSEKAKKEVEEKKKREEELKARIESEGIKTAKDKLTLRDLEVETITRGVLAKNVDFLKSMDREFVYEITSEQQLLDAGVDKEFIAWGEYNNLIGWWKREQKFFINMSELIDICRTSAIVTN